MFGNVKIDLKHLKSFESYKTTNILQKESLNLFVKSSPDVILNALRSSFLALDNLHNGNISVQQLLESLTDEEELKDINDIVKSIDFKNTGHINYSNYLAAALYSTNYLDETTVKQIFDLFDVDNKGHLAKCDFELKLGENRELDVYLEDSLSNEIMSYQEFKSKMLN